MERESTPVLDELGREEIEMPCFNCHLKQHEFGFSLGGGGVVDTFS